MTREYRIARERAEAQRIVENLADGRPGRVRGFSTEVCWPDHDDPEGTPPELLAYIDGRMYVLTIAPEDGWEI